MKYESEITEALVRLQEHIKLVNGYPSLSDLDSLPRTVPFTKLIDLSELFQIRLELDYDHVETLYRVVRSGTKLDPILVFPVGDSCYIVDGHHRYTAYGRAIREGQYVGPIPVRYVKNRSPKEAVITAARENRKSKLPVSRKDIIERAWQVVKSGNFSINDTMKITGISRQTIVDMRKVKEAALADRSRNINLNLPWHLARNQYNNPHADEWIPPTPEEREAKRQGLFNKIFKATGPILKTKPEEIILAILQEAPESALAMIREGMQFLDKPNFDDIENDDF